MAGLKVKDADGNDVTLSIRQPSSLRETGPGGENGNSGNIADNGLLTQTEVNALPTTIENAIIALAELITTIKSENSFKTSVSRVSNPDSILTRKLSFENSGERQQLTDITVPNPDENKTLAYCDLKASSQNEGPLYVGFSNTEVTSSNGRELDPGEPMSITIDDLSKIVVYSPNPGNSCSFIAYYES